jgi:serine/threonine-protein kinase
MDSSAAPPLARERRGTQLWHTSGMTISAAEAPKVGTVLDGAYQLTRLVFVGGMSVVYEAIQLKLQRRVAVKFMAAERAQDPDALARFRREVKITAKLAHPHIVQLLDFGTTPSGQAYLVTEYLEGEDMEERLQRVGRFPLTTAARIVKQIASALSAVHGKGIVHRDLKPGNVLLLSVDGAPDFPKLVDFGISKLLSSNTQLTRPSTVLGTPEYMSPEQASGRTSEVDHRVDQWGLACTAWRMVSGVPPFIAYDLEDMLRQITRDEPPALQVGDDAELSAELDRVLRKALSKRPAQRYPTISAFSRAFQAAARLGLRGRRTI